MTKSNRILSVRRADRRESMERRIVGRRDEIGLCQINARHLLERRYHEVFGGPRGESTEQRARVRRDGERRMDSRRLSTPQLQSA